MTDEPAGHTGGCLCGQVRYRLWGAPENVRVCHCDLCQAATGAPFFARVLHPRDRFEITGETARHLSSPKLARVFCPACGTPVYADRIAAPFVGVGLATLDAPNAFRPVCHMFVDFKLDFVTQADGLPQYPRWAP